MAKRAGQFRHGAVALQETFQHGSTRGIGQRKKCLVQLLRVEN